MKTEILQAFNNVIAAIQKELDKQTSLIPYVKLEGKLEAYQDALTLLGNTLPDDGEEEPVAEEKAPKPAKPAKNA